MYGNMRSYWVVPVVCLAQYFVLMAKGEIIQEQHVSLVIFCSPFLLYSPNTQIVILGILESTSLTSPFTCI